MMRRFPHHEPAMHRLLSLLLLLFVLPASAGLFDQRPVPAQLGAALNNSADFLPVSEAFKLNLIDSSNESIKLRFVAAEGYYLYRHRFSFSAEPATVRLGEAVLPAGQAKTDEYFGEVEVYYEVLDIEVPVENPDNLPFNLSVNYQGCADKGLCYPPETTVLAIGGGAASANTSADAATSWSWTDLALFFLGGLALTFTPCVLPMLPILTGVVLRGQPGGLRSLVLSLAYVLPMALSFAILGALMGLFGAELNLQARLQSPWVLVPFAIFFALFGAASLGFLELRLPAALDGRLQRLSQRLHGGTIFSAAALGVLSSVLVSPCVSAPLAGAIWLLERVVPGPVSLALWGLLAGGVALWLGALELTPKTHHQKLAQLLGLPLLIYALVAWVGALQGQDVPLRPLGRMVSSAEAIQVQSGQWQTISTPAQLQAALSAAQNSGRPLLLDWYADWCISCKVIEREVLSAPQVSSQLGDYQLVRFDITESNAEQRALLDRYQLFGPPAILLFDAKGNEWRDLRVVGEIDASGFAARLSQARERF